MPVVTSQNIARSGSLSNSALFFRHVFPHERSDLSHWRKRFADKLAAGREPAGGARIDALRSQDLKRVTIDTTMQRRAIAFPTDAKLLHAAIKEPDRLAR